MLLSQAPDVEHVDTQGARATRQHGYPDVKNTANLFWANFFNAVHGTFLTCGATKERGAIMAQIKAIYLLCAN